MQPPPQRRCPSRTARPPPDAPGGRSVPMGWCGPASSPSSPRLAAAGIALFTLVVRPADEERIPLILSTGAVLAALGAVQEVHRVGLSTRDGAALGAGFVVALVVATAATLATLDRRALRPALVT